jgi:O-antigen/teichoic acid export membrane protein
VTQGAAATGGAALLLFGTRSASALALFAVNVYLADRLGPDAFGQYSFVVAFVAFVCLFLDFGYFASAAKLLVETGSECERQRQLGAVLVLALAASGLLVVLVAAAGLVAEPLLSAPVASLLVAVSLVAPGKLAPIVMEQVLRAVGRPNLLALWTAAQVGFFVAGLAVAEAFGRLDALAASVAVLAAALAATGLVVARLGPRFRGLGEVLGRIHGEQRTFGQALYVGRTVNLASYRSDVLLLAHFRTAADVGMYNLAMSMASFVMFFAQAVTAHRFRDLGLGRPIPAETQRLNVAGIAVVAVGSLLGGVTVVQGYLGPAYAPVQTLLVPSLIAIACQAAYQPYNAWLLANGRGTELQRFLMLMGGVNLALNVILIPTAGAFGAAVASALGMGGYLVLAGRAYRRLQRAGAPEAGA